MCPHALTGKNWYREIFHKKASERKEQNMKNGTGCL